MDCSARPYSPEASFKTTRFARFHAETQAPRLGDSSYDVRKNFAFSDDTFVAEAALSTTSSRSAAVAYAQGAPCPRDRDLRRAPHCGRPSSRRCPTTCSSRGRVQREVIANALKRNPPNYARARLRHDGRRRRSVRGRPSPDTDAASSGKAAADMPNARGPLRRSRRAIKFAAAVTGGRPLRVRAPVPARRGAGAIGARAVAAWSAGRRPATPRRRTRSRSFARRGSHRRKRTTAQTRREAVRPAVGSLKRILQNASGRTTGN